MDRPSVPTLSVQGGLASLAALLGVALALVGIWIAGFGGFNESLLRVGTYALGGAVLLAVALDRHLLTRKWISLIFDLVVVGALAVSVWRWLSIGQALETGLYFFSSDDILIGVIGLFALLELTRRSFGLPLVVVCLLLLAYAYFGRSLPSIFRHGGYSLDQIVRTVWYSFDGVFGGPLSVVVTLILVFIVFGAVLEAIGAGAVLLRFAVVATGRFRGGPAHAAIAASGVFGTMSGSVSGNVVGTGVMTIPMIKERGFKASFAGGVEAAASAGGQFMPPIMGAVAFIMSDVTGIPYLTICLAALLPAIFYYGALFVAVHVEAVARGVKRVPQASLPKLTAQDWRMSLCFVLPLVLMLAIMMSGRSPAMAGFVAVIAVVVLGLILNPEVRRKPLMILEGLKQAGIASAQILVAVGSIGIVIGVMNMTGLGLRFAGLIQSAAGESLLFSLVLMMLGSLVLGMGMPTVPAYLIVVLVMGPAIEQMGVPTLIAHLFVVYFGVLSAITPPVAIAAFAAAPIAKANPVAIGAAATRLALVGFLIPFVMVYNPSLTLVVDVTVTGLVWVCIRLALAIWMLTTGFAGYGGTRLPAWSRALRLVLGFAVLVPEISVEAAATLVALALCWLDWRAGRSDDAPAVTPDVTQP
ncbi:TRAP transporter fused permease subunit [Pararhodobacter sp. CCB-MM2]|uniref:TRAP transporter permease n=1 Tax=Pararhodobacter sp. CCB-MM2 TaxID=1786003 RepID=UPI0009F51A9E|nr:TRAP transporter fused permease subunit [Pararhodobacter sp. CCB-MM2]